MDAALALTGSVFPAEHHEPPAQAIDHAFSVRPLAEQDASAFRAVRLEALEKDGHFFGKPKDDEHTFTLEQWRDRCKPTPDECWFGLYDNKDLIGISHVHTKSEDTAEGGALYVKSEYRQHGLTNLLMKAQLEWMHRNSKLKFAEVYVREDNVASRHLCEEHLHAVQINKGHGAYGDATRSAAIHYRIDLANLRL